MMKTIKELETDMKLALAISNKEWITRVDSSIKTLKDVLELIDEINKKAMLQPLLELKARISG